MGINELIAQGMTIPKMESPDERAARKMKTAMDQVAYEDTMDARARKNQLREFMSTADRNAPGYIDELYRRDPAAAMGEEKSRSEIAKANAAMNKDTADTAAKQFDTASKQRAGLIQGIASVKDRPDLSKPMVMSVAQGLLKQGLINQTMFEGIVGETPDDPTQLREFLDSAQNSLIDAEKQMTDATRRSEGTLDRGNQMTIAQMNNARMVSEGDKNRFMTQRGQNMTDTRAATKATQPGRAMSATAQKELFEAEDMVDSAKSAAAALTDALKINKDAYSGYGAGTRATIMSNLGGSKAADATVTLDNIIQGQALSSMKAIFGGNPTEGERKILLDLQAASSKTPGQREEIIKRAQSAMERRVKFNTDKAASLRSGKYFSEQSQDGEDPVASRRAESGPVSVTSRDEVDRLPSGTQFTGPDGVVRVKP